MKNQTPLLALILSLVFGAALAASALDNKFTYQCRLTDDNSPATATYQMQFRLRDGPSDTSAVLATMPPQAVPVVDGLFDVKVDFPIVLFDGNERWLEISVAPTSTPPTFAVLVKEKDATIHALERRLALVEKAIASHASAAPIQASNVRSGSAR